MKQCTFIACHFVRYEYMSVDSAKMSVSTACSKIVCISAGLRLTRP